MNRWIPLALFTIGCASNAEKTTPTDTGHTGSTGVIDTADTADTEPEPEPVVATVRLLDALSSAGVDGLSVADAVGTGTCTTDARGECDVELAGTSAYQLVVTGDSVLNHQLFGQAGTEDFTTISFVATPNLTRQIYSMLGISRDTSAGTVVVGLDTPSLAPATGASAAIDADAELAFVLGSRLPEEGTTLVAGGSSIVTFVNVPPGPVTVTATGASGTSCGVTPARSGNTHTIEAIADVVSVVTFICE